jgi:hypothetical protein
LVFGVLSEARGGGWLLAAARLRLVVARNPDVTEHAAGQGLGCRRLRNVDVLQRVWITVLLYRLHSVSVWPGNLGSWAL